MSRKVLQGRKILVVEDEFFQAREIAEMIASAGGQVIGPTATASEVPGYLAAGKIDAALLDINLGGGIDFVAANALLREEIPFAFMTGYDTSVLPPHLSATPRLQKPANRREVVRMLHGLLSPVNP
jgi:two-component SAPR family response regulator